LDSTDEIGTHESIVAVELGASKGRLDYLDSLDRLAGFGWIRL